MGKYRIIETSTPKITVNRHGYADFVPEIFYIKGYYVEQEQSEFWGLRKYWVKVRFWYDYGVRDTFKSIEEAQKWIDFREEPIKRKVVCKE